MSQYRDEPDYDEYDDNHVFWECNACGSQNSSNDGECQFCCCEGAECKRDSCSEPEHFHAEHTEEDKVTGCTLCNKGGSA